MQQGVPPPQAQQGLMPPPATAVVTTQNRDVSCCYKFWCGPCWVMEVEGLSGMTICCWIACALCWPWNGCCVLCYEPVPQQRAAVVTTGHPPAAQPAYAQGVPVGQPVASAPYAPPQPQKYGTEC